METPDCPEMYEEDAHPQTADFQKYNRYLFSELDEKISEGYHAVYPKEKEKEKEYDVFPSPVVEWAVNILPSFHLPCLEDVDAPTLEDKIAYVVTTQYDPAELGVYVQQAWAYLHSHWPPNDLREWTGPSGLLDRLRCTMCYPARLSLLTD
jgi:hypothetical protein